MSNLVRETLHWLKTTKRAVVYGNEKIRAVYVPKELIEKLDDDTRLYPTQLVITLGVADERED